MLEEVRSAEGGGRLAERADARKDEFLYRSDLMKLRIEGTDFSFVKVGGRVDPLELVTQLLDRISETGLISFVCDRKGGSHLLTLPAP